MSRARETRLARFVRGAAIVAATMLVTVVAVLYVTIHAFTAQPGDWSVPIRFGMLGVGPTVDTSVASLIRVATQPVGTFVLDGRTVATAFGTLRFARIDDGLAIDCRPCSIRIPGLGNDRIAVDAARITLIQRADRLSGSITSGDIRGQYGARFDARSMRIDAAFDRAPIAAYYRLFGDRVPETRIARIDGTASFALRASLPDGSFTIRPTIDGFAVSGLGTGLLAGRMPAVDCSQEAMRGAVRARLRRDPNGFGSWLPRAVVAAEDQRYDQHPGYDLVELAASLSRNAEAVKDGTTTPRGASTIPQQLARILYVGSERSTSRKLRELLYAVEMEQTLGKARLLQIYLAVAPWGDGVCGADAAAARYFHVDATRLSGAQAVWLAAMLHAPDTEFDRWEARGGIDLARATRIAQGLPRTNAATRSRVIADLATMAQPVLPALDVASDPAVAKVAAGSTAAAQ